MKTHVKILISAFFLLGVLNTEARDTRQMFSVHEAITTEKAKEVLDGSVRFYFGNQGHPAVVRDFGEFTSNKKTNAFNKSDKGACDHAFLSALVSFQQRAQTEGGNAVINIRSYYKKNEISSTTEYECGAGAILAGVTFKGNVVKLAQ